MSTAAPRLTVGIPVYNGEAFLEEAIESHLGQTFTDFEIVISDNGSTDRTEEICRRYAEQDERVRYVRQDVNRGAGWNFNEVLRLARGELFKWSAADDVCAPTLLERCVDALDGDRELVVAHSRASIIDEVGLVQYGFEEQVRLGPWPGRPRARTARLLEALFQSGLGAVALVHGVARTEALRSIRTFGSYFGSDYALVTELATVGGIHEVPAHLAYFRRHAGSSSAYQKRPSAARMQQFFRPGTSSRLRAALNLRRRYFELTLVLLSTDRLSPLDRAYLLMKEGSLLFRRLAWRIRFEFGAARDAPVSERRTPRHWRRASDTVGDAT